MSTTTIGSGESINIDATKANLDDFDRAAAIHQEGAGQCSAEAEQMVAAAERMQADLAAAQMDGNTMAAVANLLDVAAAHRDAARNTASTAEQVAAAVRDVGACVSAHNSVAEAVQAKGEVATTDYYKAS